MSKIKTATLLTVIIIIAIFLRTYHLKTDPAAPPGLYPDEAMNGTNALEAIATGEYKIFYPENNGREGLFINIQALFVKYFGNQPWVLRLPSAIFGILTVLGVYFLARELFSSNVALFSAFLIATSFWHIVFSRIGFRAIMAPAFLTWAIYLLLKSLRNPNSKFYILYSVAAGAAYGLGFHSYIAYRATPPLILLILGWYLWQNKDWVVRRKIFLVACLVSLVATLVILPLGLYFLNHPADFLGRTTQVSVFSSPSPLKDLGLNILKTAGMFNFVGDFNWRHNYAGQPQLFWPVGILFLIGISIGLLEIWKLFKNWKLPALHSFSDGGEIGNSTSQAAFSAVVLFAWLALAALPVVVSNEGLPHALRSILMIPPVFILAGFGGVWLAEKFKVESLKLKVANQNPKIFNFVRSFLMFVLGTWLLINVYQTYFLLWANNPNTRDAFAANYAELGNKLNSLPPEIPKYVIVNAGGTDVRGLPMPTQTAMFLTDTFTPEKQKVKNIFYVLPRDENKIPAGALKFYLQ